MRLMLSALAAKAVVALLCSAMSAQAHDWYPLECCHQFDCAPVDQAVAAGDDLVVTTKIGTAPVPPNMERRQSKDHRVHACIAPRDGKMSVICIFMPPGN